MRSLLRFSVFCLVGVALPAMAQVARPQFRPAVLGSKPDSLINRIDVKALLEKGQKDGAVMFCAQVSKTGEIVGSSTYRGTGGTEALEQELIKRLDHAKLAPAIYNYQPVEVVLFGTLAFSEVAPHLRLLLNQDPAELKTAKDFIAPQPVIGGDSKFSGLHYPEVPGAVIVTGMVTADMKVDVSGNLKNLAIRGEERPLLGFGQAALSDFTGAKFIPPFRDGDVTEAETVLMIPYK